MTINNIENLESGASVRGKLNNVISEVNSLGTAANADIGDFATSAQGTLADTAVQPSDLSIVATTNNYNDLNNLPSLGSISTQNSNNVTITGGSITGTAITGDLIGNASTATALQTVRTIGGVSFDGTANIDLPGVNIGGNQNTTGNASTATALQTVRTIGGVSFDGTANINLPGVNIGGNQNTTGSAASLTTARTLTIGSTGKTFNGTADVSWSLSDIGVGTLGQQNSNSVTITGGTINGTSIGATTASTGAFTSGTFSGNVGIGTTSPNALLHVNAASGAPAIQTLRTRQVGISTTLPENQAYQRLKITVTNIRRAAIIKLTWSMRSGVGVSTQHGGTATLGVSRADGGAGFRLIKVENPGVTGSIAIDTPVASGNDIIFGFRAGNNGTGTTYNLDISVEIVSLTPQNFVVEEITGTIASTGASLFGVQSTYTNGTERLRITSTGNVGIGTSSPTASLETPGQIVGGPSSGNAAPVSATTLAGFTGLGSFNNSTAVEDIDALYLRKGGTNGGSVGISFGSASGNDYYVGARIKHLRSGTSSNGHLVFETKEDSKFNTTVERMRITDAGKILAAAGTNWVGTVSQNGQSSIIERGSNANGEFVKYADGTLICTFTSATTSITNDAVGNGFRSASIVFTFPVAYIAVPVVTLGCQFFTGTSALSPECNGPTSTTEFSARLNSFSNNTQGQIRYTSVGRWF